METTTIIVIIVVAVTLVALAAIGTRFVAFLVNVAIQADKEKNDNLAKTVTDLKRELEEMKGKMKE